VTEQGQMRYAVDRKPFSRASLPGVPIESPARGSFLALSLDFVAKPHETANLETKMPAALTGTLSGVPGFAGCLVLISDQESRLVSVITFWSGGDRVRRCAENRRWVQALVEPYVDGCLRGRTYLAHLPTAAFAPSPGVQVSRDFARETEKVFAA
jgi:hypothetical protein